MRKTFLSAVSFWILSMMTTTAQVKLQPTQIDQVLKAMTLEEKAALVVGGNRRISVEENNGMVGSHSHQVPGAAGMTQAIQRLGIPATVLTDGPAGVRISPTRQNDTAQASLWALPWHALGTPSWWRKWGRVLATKCWSTDATCFLLPA